jgi:hypothetical protein
VLDELLEPELDELLELELEEVVDEGAGAVVVGVVTGFGGV